MIRIEHHPSRRQLTVFGLSWLVFFGFLGGVSWWRTGSLLEIGIFLAVGTMIPAAGLIWPEILRIVYLLANYATFPIGLAVSFVILVVLYYLVLTPIGLVLRLAGYDPMQRRFDRSAKTYWTPREREEKAEQYFHQF
jgi:hypothetical protein